MERSIITEDEIKDLLKEKASKDSEASELGKENTKTQGNSKRRFSLDNERLKPYCGEMSDQEIENLIYQLITEWGEKKA